MSEFNSYVCSNCGEICYYDGRCGDGPVLQCSCTKDSIWVNEGSRGGYSVNAEDAHPVLWNEYVGGKSQRSKPELIQPKWRDERWDREDD